MIAVWHRFGQNPTRFLLRIYGGFARARDRLARTDNAVQLLSERFARLFIIVVTPDHNLKNLRSNLAPALQRCPNPAASRPIFDDCGGGILIGRPSVPVTIKDVKRGAPIFKSVRTNGKIYPVDGQHPKPVVALHDPTAGGQTNIGTMDFNETRRGAAGIPLKEKHEPWMTVRSIPTGTAAFVVIQQRYRLGRDFHIFIIALGARPLRH